MRRRFLALAVLVLTMGACTGANSSSRSLAGLSPTLMAELRQAGIAVVPASPQVGFATRSEAIDAATGGKSVQGTQAALVTVTEKGSGSKVLWLVAVPHSSFHPSLGGSFTATGLYLIDPSNDRVLSTRPVGSDTPPTSSANTPSAEATAIAMTATRADPSVAEVISVGPVASSGIPGPTPPAPVLVVQLLGVPAPPSQGCPINVNNCASPVPANAATATVYVDVASGKVVSIRYTYKPTPDVVVFSIGQPWSLGANSSCPNLSVTQPGRTWQIPVSSSNGCTPEARHRTKLVIVAGDGLPQGSTVKLQGNTGELSAGYTRLGNIGQLPIEMRFTNGMAKLPTEPGTYQVNVGSGWPGIDVSWVFDLRVA